MINISLSTSLIDYSLYKNIFNKNSTLAQKAYLELSTETCQGSDFLGWISLPKDMAKSVQEIEAAAHKLIQQSEIVVVIGIGGSYLGARAINDMLSGYFDYNKRDFPKLIYAGHNLSEDYIHDLCNFLDNKEYSIIVISKSGTTTEPAIAFRILKQHCALKYGNKYNERIVAITDREKGSLKQLSKNENFKTFFIPDNVGGRFSVLTAVGLLPIAVAGHDIADILTGANQIAEYLLCNNKMENNISLQYAIFRNILYQLNKKIELFASFEPKLFYFIEWLKQLFGESEGKEHKGIFPAGAIFSTDLHSLGQYIQDGERAIFETFISIKHNKNSISIPFIDDNLDKLNYLTKFSINDINHIAEKGTQKAHVDGGVPNIKIEIPEINSFNIGQLIYFFEFTCAISGYILGVNPFDQPGVEAYKKNMFQLLCNI